LRFYRQLWEEVGGAAVEYEGANETVVCTLAGITTDVGARQVLLIGVCYFTLAAETGTTTIRIRRGTTTAGHEVAKVVVEGVAAKKNECSIQAIDNVEETAQGNYCLTMTESKAGSKPKSVESRLRAEC